MLLKKLDLDSPEYKFFYCNGKVQDIPVLYTTQTGKIDEKDKVSTERISIGKIGQALAEVSSFRYDISNMDIFASNESDNLIKRDYLRTLYFLSVFLYQ